MLRRLQAWLGINTAQDRQDALQRRVAVLRVVCSWCGAVIAEGNGHNGPVSHGICPTCLAAQLKDLEL